MVKPVNSQDKPTAIGHIIFPYTPIVKQIFLEEVISYQTDIFLNDKRVTTQQVSTKLQRLLTEKGFSVKRSEKRKLKPRNTVCGIEITIQKNFQGKTLKEIVVGVPAFNSVDLVVKQQKLIKEIREIVPDIKFEYSVADKFVRC